MQASSCFVQPLLPSTSANIRSPVKLSTLFNTPTRRFSVKASPVAFEPLSFNYNSPFSVFPAEACETVGGDACSANMYPEVQPKSSERKGTNRVVIEQFEREYFDYNSEQKSVLRGEACDDLGGEFCEAPYTRGVY